MGGGFGSAPLTFVITGGFVGSLPATLLGGWPLLVTTVWQVAHRPRFPWVGFASVAMGGGFGSMSPASVGSWPPLRMMMWQSVHARPRER